MNKWIKTKCCYCGKEILVAIPRKYARSNSVRGVSCYDCVPEDSAARNGIDEAVWEIKG